MTDRKAALSISATEFREERTSLEGYNRDLGYLSEWLEQQDLKIENMTADHWQEFIEARGWAYKSERRALSAVRYYLRQTLNGKHKEHALYSVPWPKGVRKLQRRVTLKQRDELLQACDDGRDPERDWALVHLFFDTGIRNSELARAEWEYLDLSRCRLRVPTKAKACRGRQWETKTFGPATAKALREWESCAGAQPTIFGLSIDGVSSVIDRLEARVGFKVSPHDFRRGRGARFAEKHVSDRLAMKALGIKSPAVWQRYSEDAELDALDESWDD